MVTVQSTEQSSIVFVDCCLCTHCHLNLSGSDTRVVITLSMVSKDILYVHVTVQSSKLRTEHEAQIDVLHLYICTSIHASLLLVNSTCRSDIRMLTELDIALLKQY